MYADDQRKPKSIYHWGPETEPQGKALYHGMGIGHPLVYTSNPVSWYLDADGGAVPFMNITSGNAQDDPADRAALDELDALAYGAAPFNDEPPAAVTSPRSARKNPLVETAIGGPI